MFWHTHALKMTLATCSSCAIGEKAMEDNASPITLQERNCTIQSVIQKHASCVILTEIGNQSHSHSSPSINAGLLLHLLLGAQVLILLLSFAMILLQYFISEITQSLVHSVHVLVQNIDQSLDSCKPNVHFSYLTRVNLLHRS